jgi:hypothetical protein
LSSFSTPVHFKNRLKFELSSFIFEEQKPINFFGPDIPAIPPAIFANIISQINLPSLNSVEWQQFKDLSRVSKNWHAFFSHPNQQRNITAAKAVIQCRPSPPLLLPVAPTTSLVSQLSLWLYELQSIDFIEERNLFGLEPYEVHYAIGDCLFEAVAAFLPQQTGAQIRALAIAHIQQDPQLRARITELGGTENNQIRIMDTENMYHNVHEYLELMSHNQAWGSEIELLALARALLRPIVILTPNNSYDQIIEEDDYAHNKLHK